MTELLTTTVPTDFGTLAIVADAATGVVYGSGFRLLTDVIAGLRPDLAARGFRPADPETAMPARDAVVAWSAGDLDALTAVAVEQPGGDFTQRAWAAMRQIPPGRTATYAEIAALAGNPKAVRAAGTACARNQVAPFVPCHRVVSSNGGLGGYGFGLEVKAAMLRHEQAG